METSSSGQPIWKRALLKLSGESLAGDKGFGIDPQVVAYLANEVAQVHQAGVEVAVVVGGGNIVRGGAFAQNGMNQAAADQMGMLATLINSLALQDAIERLGIDTRVQSALTIQSVAEPFIRRRAIRHLEKGRIVILAAGIGNPYFTTDTAAALRAVELGAGALLKGTNVDGVYDRDPHVYPDAVKYETLSYQDALTKKLRVMDLTAFTLCMERDMEIVVFDIREAGNAKRVVMGAPIGTRVKNL